MISRIGFFRSLVAPLIAAVGGKGLLADTQDASARSTAPPAVDQFSTSCIHCGSDILWSEKDGIVTIYPCRDCFPYRCARCKDTGEVLVEFSRGSGVAWAVDSNCLPPPDMWTEARVCPDCSPPTVTSGYLNVADTAASSTVHVTVTGDGQWLDLHGEVVQSSFTNG